MNEKLKAILIGVVVFILGIFISQIGVFNGGDAYITSIGMVHNSVIFLSSIVSIVGYLIIKELKSK